LAASKTFMYHSRMAAASVPKKWMWWLTMG
jgi:hypothetical protein